MRFRKPYRLTSRKPDWEISPAILVTMGHPKQFTTYKQTGNTIDSTDSVVLCIAITDTASTGNDGAGVVDCDYHRAVGPTKIIRGVL